MMRSRHAQLALWAIALGGALAAVLGWRASLPVTPVAPAPAFGRATAVVPIAPDTLRIAADRVAETDPFRLDRHPAAVAYRPELEGMPQTVSRSPRPPLVVQGIVGLGSAGRARWGGLLGGIPGRDGAVLVHAGDTVGGLTVRRVGRDTVVVSGSDTTWRLTVRQAWQ